MVIQPTKNAQKCIIIHSTTKDLSQVNHDNVRAAVASTSNKPILIEIINRDKPTSLHQKYIVQLADEKLVDTIIKNWKPTHLGGSTARKSIKLNNNTAVLKDVPNYIPGDQLKKEIEKSCGTTVSIYRLKSKEGKPLHTVRITFKTNEQLEHAIKNSIPLDSINLILPAMKFIAASGTANKKYTSTSNPI